ncbi:MAG: SulP family inorganic anion transporter [Gammaproteobacteria bacterium]|nr:SulP family inorganic anion transporter [Gammaproteobacteria bacterium]MDE2251004.1 SulP family inorganic anion transporter [Gammaproteobacteria bacterium]
MVGQAALKRLGPDLVAGLSVAGLVLPEALAYAGIAGVPPLAGLLAAIAGLLTYALLGTSRYAIVAATSSSAAVLASALHPLAGANPGQTLPLAAAMVLLAGLLFLLCGLLRLGRMAQFIARPVVRGFTLGLALIIAARQLAKLCGFHATQSALGPVLLELYARRAEWRADSLLLGAGALLLLALLRRWPRLPGTLAVLVLGGVAAAALGTAGNGIALVGPIGLGVIRPQLPALDFDTWLRTAELAVALMLILFAESYGSMRACALRHGDRLDVNRELLALGAANLAAGLLQGVPVGAGYSATTANESFGARSRLAGGVAAMAVAAALWLLRGWVALIPEPVLAAIVIFAMRHAVSIEPLRPYLAWRRDRWVVVTAVAAVLLLGILNGLLAGIAVSLVLLIRELTQPRLTVLGRMGGSHDFIRLGAHPEVRPVEGLLILRPEEPLFFANVEAVLDNAAAQLAAVRGVRTLVLSLEESPNLDGTCVEVLGQFAAQVAREGCALRLARLKDPVLEVLARANLPGLAGVALSGASVDAVVASITQA